MSKDMSTYLKEVIFRTNILIDSGESASFDEVHDNAQNKSIIEWLADKGADMSILLSEQMTDERESIQDALASVSSVRAGDEGRKLGVRNNGLCLLIALALEALEVNA